MQANGLVAKTEDDRYELTDLGGGLKDVVFAIGRWAYPLMGEQRDGETFRAHWIAHPIAALYPGVDPARPELTIEVRCAERAMTIRSSNGRVTVVPGTASAPDLVMTGRPDLVVGLLAARLTPDEARVLGLSITGDVGQLRNLKPLVPTSA